MLVTGATVAGIALLDAGVSDDHVVASIGLVCVALVALLERVHPYRKAYNTSRGDVATDLWHNLISGIVLPEVVRVMSFGAVYWCGSQLTRLAGFQTWPTSWPLAMQLVFALVVAELGSYWFHRVQHTAPWWWRIHATHHSAPRLYWLNAGRFHPLDGVFSYAILMLPLVVLGAPPTTLALYTVFLTAHGLLQHSNIDMRHGGLSWIFSTAELHRWHHAPDPTDGNHNYGAVLAIWDVVFGTRYLPADREPPEAMGIGAMPHFPASYLAQLASPFTWKRLAGQTTPDGDR